jgi:hypothetical protein
MQQLRFKLPGQNKYTADKHTWLTAAPLPWLKPIAFDKHKYFSSLSTLPQHSILVDGTMEMDTGACACRPEQGAARRTVLWVHVASIWLTIGILLTLTSHRTFYVSYLALTRSALLDTCWWLVPGSCGT